MIEAPIRHAGLEHDPMGREPHSWPQRRPSQIAIHEEDSKSPKHSISEGSGTKEEDVQHVLKVAEPNVVADLTARSGDPLAKRDGLDTREKVTETLRRRISRSTTGDLEKDKVLKLSPEKIQELLASPESIPVRPAPEQQPQPQQPPPASPKPPTVEVHKFIAPLSFGDGNEDRDESTKKVENSNHSSLQPSPVLIEETSHTATSSSFARPSAALSRAASSPATARRKPSRDDLRKSRHVPTPLKLDTQHEKVLQGTPGSQDQLPSPMPASIPLPPLSLPTYLHLELASTRPSPLYIHRSATSDSPYESSRVKLERLQNFLFLPPQLEQVLWYGTLACLDAWLYTFTILPLRFFKAVSILIRSWMANIATEARFVASFIYEGTGRMWHRRRVRGGSLSEPVVRDPQLDNSKRASRDEPRRPTLSERPSISERPSETGRMSRLTRRHRRTKSVPSALLPNDKADILKGLLIIATCALLMRLNASRMYHWIRQQAAIKLYVIYNVLEVGDRLLSAIGQDVLECLFSREALERKPDGRSKVLRPFWLFVLALIYNTVHATALFYQVITLNVAVNSYSNALITLLISNQFVEIKSTVFKKFEKENLFQLTCADVVERFQLWLMLVIIASRNIVETGGLNNGFTLFFSSPSSPATPVSNTSDTFSPPRSSASILPSAFELLPNLFSSVTAYAPSVGHILAPFLVVLGSEMFVDWLKHAYIGKFNNTRPAIYGRFLDVLAKDYYSHAFSDQNLTKRLGLPVIPLSCLFIRACVQTYEMFLAAWVPAPLPSSSIATSLITTFTSPSNHEPTSTTAALSQQIDALFRQLPVGIFSSNASKTLTTIILCLLVYVVLLALKLVLGMVLLSFSRSRYRSMKQREKSPGHHVEGGRRIGTWGIVELDEDKKRWIYEDDPAAAKASRDREIKDRERQAKDLSFEKVKRYEMAAKRIW